MSLSFGTNSLWRNATVAEEERKSQALTTSYDLTSIKKVL